MIATSYLVTRLIDIEIQDHYVPGRTETTVEILEPTDIRFYKYYESTYTVVHEPGYLFQSEVVRLETNIYDVASESLIWTAISETFNPESASDMVRTYGVEVIKNLEKNKLLN